MAKSLTTHFVKKPEHEWEDLTSVYLKDPIPCRGGPIIDIPESATQLHVKRVMCNLGLRLVYIESSLWGVHYVPFENVKRFSPKEGVHNCPS